MPDDANRLRIDRSPGRLLLVLSGDWTRDAPVIDGSRLRELLSSAGSPASLTFDSRRLERWDSLLVLFVLQVKRIAEEHSVVLDLSGLPAGAGRLLELSQAVPERRGVDGYGREESLLARIGLTFLGFVSQARDLLRFTGEASIALVRLVTGRARFNWRDLLLFMQESSFEALPIVGLIAFLIGMIMAFVGIVQLQAFGAQIYVADLVGISVTREMGAIMVAIIMAGRTGAAYAAQLGSMQVNEEIDALVTLGLPPMEYLVLPRLLALFLMMPLLVIYADLIGIAGGLLASVNLSNIGVQQFLLQISGAVGFNDIAVGVFKGGVFGLLVASAGCYHGLRSGRSSASVGRATTAAVVMSVVSIVVADALVTVVTTLTGI